MITKHERLILAGGCRRESCRSSGQIKGIAMPMQHGGELAVQMTNRRRASGLSQRKRAPAEFCMACGIDSRAQRACNELRTQADAEGRQAGCDAFLDHRQQWHEGWVASIVAGTDRAAQHDHQRRRDGIRRFDAGKSHIEVAHRPPARA